MPRSRWTARWCSSTTAGFRTFLAGSYLEMKGYRVMRLFGGMQGWQEMQAAK